MRIQTDFIYSLKKNWASIALSDTESKIQQMVAPPVFRSFGKSPDESIAIALDIAGPPRRSGERRGLNQFYPITFKD